MDPLRQCRLAGLDRRGQLICSIDSRASAAGAAALSAGGSAADAAIATSAVLAVVAPYACGMGGDLFALVHDGSGTPACLNASGLSGSLAEAEQLRSSGLTSMARHGDPSVVTIPGCVDGWLALHARFGRRDLAAVLAPAIALAETGFAAGQGLARSAADVAGVRGNTDIPADLEVGDLVSRPGSARALSALLSGGREAFYGGQFGEGLRQTCPQITLADLAASQADWVEPLQAHVWGHDVWTTPPNSQGYITLASALLVQDLDLPTDPTLDLWAHLAIESSRQAGWDRPAELHDRADGAALISRERLSPRGAAIDPDRASNLPGTYAEGGTIYLCAVDEAGMGVSLIQSNAQGFGARLVAGDTGIFLHNRGLGFSLDKGHPAEFGPQRRPPHTLSPALVTRSDGGLRAVLGTMGGDAQPQIVLQMLARLLHSGESPEACVNSPRWRLAAPAGHDGFDTWSAGGEVRVIVEEHGARWTAGLRERGHQVEVADGSAHGHAHMIELTDAGELRGAVDQRAPGASCAR
jgi:gamma-glutamyltranspeptidase/glutathione hydrolase